MLRGMVGFHGRLHVPDTDGNGGTEPAAPAAPVGEQNNDASAEAVAAAFQRRLERSQGNAVALAEQLWRDNYAQREEIRQLRTRIPAEGALILTGDAATLHQQYAALGRRPDEVAAALAELDTLRTQARDRARNDLVSEAAEAAGFKAPVLARLAPPDLEIVVKPEQKNGKPVKVAYVTAGGKETPLADYAAAAWPDFLPALKAEAPRPALGTPQIPAQPANGQPHQVEPARPLVNF